MDVSEYDCGVRQDENKKIKLGDSYSIAVDSGYDSIYNGCTSVLLEKSFSRESFDIFSPSTPNRTPGKKCSTLKYHVSTPKANASTKRHLYSARSSTFKRSKAGNEENEPKTDNSSISRSDFNDNSCPLKALYNSELSPQKNILSATTTQSFQKSFKNDSFFDSKQHSMCASFTENPNERIIVPERPLKNQRYFTPLVIHSKRKLEILPAQEKSARTYCNGARYINIIGKLEPFPAILDDIFKCLNNKDLLHLSLVSKNWNTIVKSNLKANARIQHYLNESRNVKENLKEPIKSSTTFLERHPFSQFNISAISNKTINTSQPINSSFNENQNVVQQLRTNERLVKCPRCSKGSIISESSARLQSTSLIEHVPHTSDDSQCATSLVQKSESVCEITRDKFGATETTSSPFGVCTSLACKYMFCPKCLCDYHPGQNCKISEPESPSKLLVCHKKLKQKTKSTSKLSSKRQSLRRLCFS